jgi:hypothetical protein
MLSELVRLYCPVKGVKFASDSMGWLSSDIIIEMGIVKFTVEISTNFMLVID